MRGSLLVLAVLLLAPIAKSDEGMWMLPLLKQQNLTRMQELGLRISAEEIYNTTGDPSLTNTIVHFGGGCTGEVVSPNGLIFTNHHCGYGEIQSHSSVENNYLREGFYAPRLEDELPNKGLTVTFTEEIIDVTDFVENHLAMNNVTDPMLYLSRKYLRGIAEEWYKINRGTDALEREKGLELVLAPFYEGNRYVLFVRRVYSDVRLVAAPPTFIGSYGSDTDNWTWPRHSGDFTVFRVYTAPDGSPAEYSADNIPMRPKNFLRISTKGVERDDFVMIIGFPGTTRHFYTAGEVAQFRDVNEQIRINMREVRQNALYEEMLKDEAVHIQYAAKYSGSTNAYKRAIGNNWASEKVGFEAIKRSEMEELKEYAEKADKPEYITAIQEIEALTAMREEPLKVKTHLDEGIWRPIELLRLAPMLDEASFNEAKKNPERLQKLLSDFEKGFDKDYNAKVDRKVTKAMVKAFLEQAPKTELFQGATDVDAYVDYLFDHTIYRSAGALEVAVREGTFGEYLSDPLVQLRLSYEKTLKDANEALAPIEPQLRAAKRLYQKGMLEMHGDLNLWPDANSTIRYTFGQVRGYSPRDQVFYGHQTTLEGVFEKEDPESEEYYILPPLRDIYERGEYGELALDSGKMPVNFCATTHTTGGNSGSPVLNGDGHLVGLNFDRNWEGVGGDIVYLADYQRSIICDVRYVLLILDQYLGAERILNELVLVK